MDIDNCIRERRSCREYLEKQVSLESIAEILDTARFAPSAGNLQNWQVIVVRDEKKRKDLAAMCEQSWMSDAPVHLVICNKKTEVKEQFPDHGDLFSTQNCAMLASYMLLKAHALGLGTCFVGAFDSKKLQRVLTIPKEVIPEAIITVGYAGNVEETGRLEIKNLAFFEEYDKKEVKKDELWPLSKQVKKAAQKMQPGEQYKPSSLVQKAKDFITKFKRQNKE